MASKKLVRAAALVAVASVAVSCGQERSAPAQSSPATTAVSTAQALTGPVCQGTGAHTAHSTLPSACVTCHPCGGAYGLPPSLALPSGTLVSGTITHDTTGTTCSVTCHTPAGQPLPTSITWTTPGPLACSGCHTQGSVVPVGGSSHPADTSSATANRTACQACHDLSAHLSGSPRIKTAAGIVVVPPGGTVLANDVCQQCHSGTGVVIAGQTPPLLVGWTDTVSGDFHGARAGTGSGGTLAAPYVRGQPPLPCTACHDAHQSANAFLFASAANGQAIAAGTIARSGVGGEGLCTGCHLGQRHQYCLGCHLTDPQPPGSACFYCHGHEGILNFPWPTTPPHSALSPPPPGSPGDCWHCHSTWRPVPTSVPPVISAIAVTTVGSAQATVTWTTNTNASSMVEYGIASLANTARDGSLTTSHRVVLSGLTGPATYQFRVRSVDGYRNVSVSATSTFQTSDPSAPLAPVLNVAPSFYTFNDYEPINLTWQPVTSPVGNPVQYLVEITLPAAPAIRSAWLDTPSWTVTVATLLWPDQYTWHVMARDKVTGATSTWSSQSTFSIWSAWYY